MAGACLLLTSCGLDLGGLGPGTPSPSEPPSSSDPPVEPPTLSAELLPEGTQQLEIEVGETAQIYWGGSSTSVGDNWGVLSVEPEGVAEAGFVSGDSVLGFEDWEDTSTGGDGPTALEVTGIAPGTATIRVQYCFREELAEDCDPGSKDGYPTDVTVTVR